MKKALRKTCSVTFSALTVGLYTLGSPAVQADILPEKPLATIYPAQPKANQTISLRINTDDCFYALKPKVTMSANVITVVRQAVYCIALLPAIWPGKPQTIEVNLGRFPAGKYKVQLAEEGHPETPTFSTDLVITENTSTRFGQPPLMDYSGTWWSKDHMGEALMIQQFPDADDQMLVSFNTYDQNNQPTWYVMSGASWESRSKFSAEIYRIQGPSLGNQQERLPTATPVGRGTLDFALANAEQNSATFTYIINGISGTRTIEKFTFAPLPPCEVCVNKEAQIRGKNSDPAQTRGGV